MAKATGNNENENHRWSSEDDTQLKSLVMMGTKIDLVARVFKRSRRSVLARLQREHRDWWQASAHPEAKPITPDAEPSVRSIARLATVEKKIDNLTAMVKRLVSELTGTPED